MNQIKIREKYAVDLAALFKKAFGETPESIEDVRSDGSNRKLIRLKNAKRSVIGVYGPDKSENNAFVNFSRHFAVCKLPVPEIFAFEPADKIYLETDLGDQTLFDFLAVDRSDSELKPPAVDLYKKALKWLALFQTSAVKNFNFSDCYPRSSFDRQSIMWDLNYFKYYFAKLAGIPFNEQKLEDDFNVFTDFLLGAPADFFLYRDFQSRNIMIKDGGTWFIDYQGGRRGALQYDVASLLYDAKADLQPELREKLMEYYVSETAVSGLQSKEEFLKYYYPFVFVRLMQAMGAYGLRGFYEKKTHFLQSVPYVVKNIEWLIENRELPVKTPEMTKVFRKITASSQLRQFTTKRLGLNLKIYSFSYKNGIPQDFSGHNGGFVFDCRCLPNPGREEKYAALTGKDAQVAAFLEASGEAGTFFSRASEMVEQAVSNYMGRNFTDLSVCFGCTGGRHRSVYMAQKLYALFKGRKNVSPSVKHTALNK
ncbi:MAG: phosphotransferase enzyme family protein [Elusimicrobia bacterium CG08_land_8_20_14_0_20_51_18]|nr:MAG: phosphotransferase enzyme family protein [Elusimicrobia bacterium CG08_land_8_20_14_0_20_51_18]